MNIAPMSVALEPDGFDKFMSYRVWVKCKTCVPNNIFTIILDKPSNERSTCPNCKTPWQESQIVAKVNFSEKPVDHVVWM